jgi:hypothetical protein
MHSSKLILLLIIGACFSALSAFIIVSGATEPSIKYRAKVSSRPEAPQPPADAGLVPMPDLAALTRDAGAIVVGEVVAVSEKGRTSVNFGGRVAEAREMIATLNVYRWVKGRSSQTTLTFEFLIPELFSIGYPEIRASQFGIFFLRKSLKESYGVLNPYYPFAVASRNAPPTEDGDLDQVIAELENVLITASSSIEQRTQAIFFLDSVRSDRATEALRRAAKDKDALVRLQGVAALLNRNDISALNIAEDALLHPPSNVSDYLINNLSLALQNIKDPQAIPVLTRLMQARDVQTRRGAATALRRTRAVSAIDPLLTGLEDGDREVRYQSVIGLAEITGRYEWGPSLEVFPKDEQRYLAYWREWAKARQ